MATQGSLMPMTRRAVLSTAVAALTPAARVWADKPKPAAFKVGVTDWNLNRAGKPDALGFARTLGFEGIQVTLGRKPEGGKLPLAAAEVQAQYLDQAGKQKIAIAGTCLDILHVNFLKSDPLARKWVTDGIPITRKLNAGIMLLPFFGKGVLQTAAEKNFVGDALKEFAPEAEKAGVILGIENTISAEDNARMLDRAKSPAVRVYYDVGNSTQNGFDVVKELRWLGKDRIADVHLKDTGYLGEGKVDFPEVIRALADIGFSGFAILETSSPSGSIENDMRRNQAYVRKLMAP